jgi:hypothetical protein
MSGMRSRTVRAGSAVDELTGLDLGDARLHTRARRLVRALERNPAAGFPAAVHTGAEREGTYRFLGNRRVSLAGLLTPHIQQTVARAREAASRPLVVIDKTAFVFRGEGERAGLTRLSDVRQGFDAFVALGVTASRAALGVLGIQPLTANAGPSAADDWVASVQVADGAIGALDPIYVMDREADAYRLFVALGTLGRDFVVRVSPERLVQEHPTGTKELLRTVIGRTPVRLERTVPLTRRTGTRQPQDARRRHPPREGRLATLTIRACPILVPRPSKLPSELPPTVAVHLVHVREEHPPVDSPPVDWLLVTSLPISDATAISAVVDAYRARWTIEEYFKALKSGCAYEKRQLESRAALLNALGVLAPLAWRLLSLRAAVDDDAPASTVLEADELDVLRAVSPDSKLPAQPTVAEALAAIARLGGHFPQNGRPGWKILWTGFHKLRDRVEGYRLARRHHQPRKTVRDPWRSDQ